MTEKKNGGPISFILITGEEVVISYKDFNRVMKFKWRLGKNGYVYKVGGRKKGDQCLLHRYILDVKNGDEIHHLNNNKLDNQRHNLIITNSVLHQTKYHSNSIIENNKLRRIYPIAKICSGCGKEFIVNPDHRGRNKYCSRDCANKNNKDKKYANRKSI